MLARRAAGDLKVAQKLSPDPEIDEGAVGFHSQQAVEKALKVALTLEGVDFPKTHDLEFLVGLAGRHSIEVPDDVAAAGWADSVGSRISIRRRTVALVGSGHRAGDRRRGGRPARSCSRKHTPKKTTEKRRPAHPLAGCGGRARG